MITYIVTIDISSDAKSELTKVSKCGSPQIFHDTLIIESTQTQEQIKSIVGVLGVVEDEYVTPSEVVQENPKSWYLPHASQTQPDYKYTRTGKGVDIVVVDTGVRLSHNEFSGKAKTLWSYDGKDYARFTQPHPTHGTSCASCAVGKKYGIAKEANLYSVRTNFKTSVIIKGLEQVVKHHKMSDRNTIASLSFSAYWGVIKGICQTVMDHGVCLIAAAGNHSKDLPEYPAYQSSTISVGAIDFNGNTASFSNGKVQGNDIWAGGVGGYAASISHDDHKTRFSGTSASCPLVAGMMAMVLEGSEKLETRDDVRWAYDTLLQQARTENDKKMINTNVTNESFKQPPVPVVVIEPEKPEELIPEVTEPKIEEIIPEKPVKEEKSKKKDDNKKKIGIIIGVVVIAVALVYFGVI